MLPARENVEKRFYATDIAVNDQVDRLVITVTSSDEDTDTASDCDGGSTDIERTDTASGGHEASWKFHCYSDILSIAIEI